MARGLEKQTIDFINNDSKAIGLRGILAEAKNGLNRANPLLICFRKRENKDNIDIYYKGRTTINIDINKDGLSASISPDYTKDELDKNDVRIVKGTKSKLFEDDISIQTVDKIAKFSRGKIEREVQQYIVMENNESTNSNWYCVDMEYETNEYGKFDIIAISKEKNENGKYEVIITELKEVHKSLDKNGAMKIRTGSMNGKENESGIYDHFIKFEQFLKDENSVKTLKESILNILNSKCALGLCDDAIIKLNSKLTIECFDEPKVVFLTYCRDNTVQTAKKTFKHKVFGDPAGRTNKTINKYLEGENKKSDCYPEGVFRCIFREDEVVGPIFSDLEISEAKNIFDKEAYK